MDIAKEVAGLILSKEFLLRCAISGGIAGALYLVFGATFHYFFTRKVDRNIYDWRNGYSDIMLGLFSVTFGSPWLQVFGVLHERYGISPMYTDINEHGWLWWAVSIPVYLLLWDAVFYVGHLVLHTDLVYRISHRFHHAFRPPTAWSGIAIDGIETFLSGLLPYVVPLFVLPFHVYTVYAVNILLVGWATWLHSRSRWRGNWLMVGPIDHNLHHARGQKNKNFGAIFKIYDRIFGTLDTTTVPYWIAAEEKEDLAAAAAALDSAAAGKAADAKKAQ